MYPNTRGGPERQASWSQAALGLLPFPGFWRLLPPGAINQGGLMSRLFLAPKNHKEAGGSCCGVYGVGVGIGCSPPDQGCCPLWVFQQVDYMPPSPKKPGLNKKITPQHPRRSYGLPNGAYLEHEEPGEEREMPPGPRTGLCSTAAPLIQRRSRGPLRARGPPAPRQAPAPRRSVWGGGWAAAPLQARGNSHGAFLAALCDLSVPGWPRSPPDCLPTPAVSPSPRRSKGLSVGTAHLPAHGGGGT